MVVFWVVMVWKVSFSCSWGLGFESGGVFVDIIHTRAFVDVLERTREE